MSDLTTLFATDPLKLTKENLQEIVTEYRSRRHQFNSKVPGKPTKVAVSTKKIETVDGMEF